MKELSPAQRVIVALDVDDVSKAASLVDQLAPLGVSFKIGLEFIYTMILQTIFAKTLKVAYNNLRAIVKLFKLRTHQVFLDAKLKDIPNTVGSAARVIVKMGVGMFNLHCDGGRSMMIAAAEAAREKGERRPLVLGVTILTSLDYDSLAEMGIFSTQDQPVVSHGELENYKKNEVQELVVKLAQLAQSAHLDGVVCSVKEATRIRKACGFGFLIVTPGIRWEGTSLDDQKRTDSPFNAIMAGADMLVIGRPITKAEDPVAAAKFAISEVQRAFAA